MSPGEGQAGGRRVEWGMVEGREAGSYLHPWTAWGSREAKDAAVADDHETIGASRGEGHAEVTGRGGCIVPYKQARMIHNGFSCL